MIKKCYFPAAVLVRKTGKHKYKLDPQREEEAEADSGRFLLKTLFGAEPRYCGALSESLAVIIRRGDHFRR